MQLFNKLVVLVFALFFAFSPFVSAETIASRATPPGVDLTTYPLMPDHPITTAEMARMKLHPVIMTEDTMVFNFSHRIGGFFVDILKKGEIGMATEKGELVYKATCTNRISVIPPAPKPAAVTPVKPIVSGGTNVVPPPAPGFWESFLETMWNMLGDLLKFLLFLALLALLFWLFFSVLRSLFNFLRSNNGGGGTRPAPYVAPAPVNPGPLPMRQPETTTTVRRWGPFATIQVSDRQRDGYHVVGDGRELGTFSNPGRTEDDGARGHYFIIEETVN